MDSRSRREELLRQVVARAATAPLSLFLISSGVLLLLNPTTWPIGLSELGIDLLWVVFRIRDPEFVSGCSDEQLRGRWRDLISRLEHVSGALDGETATTLTGIVEAQERLLGFYAGEGKLLPASRIELIHLLERCLSLAQKRQQFHAFLASVRTLDVQREAQQIERRADEAHDTVTRHLYEQAAAQKRQELENYVRLEEAIQRIDGQLAAVSATCDNMLSVVVRMQAMDAAAGYSGPDPVVEELDRLTRGVEALEASLSEALTFRGAA